MSRRTLLGGTASLSAVMLASACGSKASGSDEGGSGAIRVPNKYGTTVLQQPPSRVVSAGSAEQDYLLAVGVIPVGVTDWYGDQPYATWPWAQPALGSAKPTVLHTTDGYEFEQIAALRPDLIVATNDGMKSSDYQKLSDIAPTLAQSADYKEYFVPWKAQAQAIGKAVGRSKEMAAKIQAVDDKFTAALTANPQMKGVKAIFLQNAISQGRVIASQAGFSTDFLTQLGMVVPPGLDQYSQGGEQAYIPKERMVEVLDVADVLIWATEKDSDQAALEADPVFQQLKAYKENRNVYTGGTLSGAIYFTSPLSLPYVVDHLVPMVTSAIA